MTASVTYRLEGQWHAGDAGRGARSGAAVGGFGNRQCRIAPVGVDDNRRYVGMLKYNGRTSGAGSGSGGGARS